MMHGRWAWSLIPFALGTWSSADHFDDLIDVARDGWELGRSGGTFVMSILGSPVETEDGRHPYGSNRDLRRCLLAGAVRRNQMSREWEGELAESWEISADRRSITITLRPGLSWSDGDDLTAQDFVFSVNEIYQPRLVLGLAYLLEIEGESTVWEYLDERRFRVSVPRVASDLLPYTSVPPLPYHIVRTLLEEHGSEFSSAWGMGVDPSAVPSSGPFVLQEVGRDRVVLQKNRHYFERDAAGVRLPYLDRLVVPFIEDYDDALEAFLSDELDAYEVPIFGLPQALADTVPRLLEADGSGGSYRVLNVGPAHTTGHLLMFNQNPIDGEGDAGIPEPQLTWLSDVSFRRAMAHLIDRHAIAELVYAGYAYPSFSPVDEVSPWYWPETPTVVPKYVPGRATEVLDSARYRDWDGDGWREDRYENRLRLTVTTNIGNEARQTICEAIATEAASVGIDVHCQLVDFHDLVNSLVSTYDWEMVIVGLVGDEPWTQLAHSAFKRHSIEPLQQSPRREWERLVDAAWWRFAEASDRETRREAAYLIQQQWLEQLPWVSVVRPAVVHAYGAEWRNVKPLPLLGYGWAAIAPRLWKE